MSRENNSEALSRLATAKDDKERVRLLYDLGREGDSSARDQVAEFLGNPDPELRYVALRVLVLDWGLREFAAAALDFLLHDPDDFNRMLAAACLGSLFRGQRDPRAFAALLQVFKNVGADLSVRLSAYSAILEVDGKGYSHLRIDDVNLTRDIDWGFLSGIEEFAAGAGFDPGRPPIPEVQAIEAGKPQWDWGPHGATMRLLESGDATVDELSAILRAIPKRAKPPHFRPRLELLLRHPSPKIRAQAVVVLGMMWMEEDLAGAFLDLVETDPDESVRAEAAASVGRVRANSRDPEALSRLADVLPKCSVHLRADVYEAFLQVAGIRSEADKVEDQWPRRIDWDLVDAIRRSE